MARKVKIKDIAARLGLSSTLVSLVLNNKADKHGIKKETQERVIALAQKMGFYENERIDPVKDIYDIGPGIIGMVVSDLKDQFIVEISDHLRKAFSSIGYGFSIITWDKNDNRFRRIVSNMRRMYAGVILAGDAADDNIIRALKASDYPFVVLERSDVNLRLNIVMSDCQAGARKLAAHLNKFNYRSVAILHSDDSAYSHNKVRCIRETMEQESEDLSINSYKIDLDITQNVDIDSVKSYFTPPDAVRLLIVVESMLVYPMIEAVRKLKLRIPGDVALVSMENGIGFDLMETSVTRLKRDIASMASKTVSILWTEIKNSGKSKYKRTVSLAPDLIVGRSCGQL
ncbi:MAG: LacI family DNA-binding transcriptional regulator [Marinilabiliaceae bacterium]|jgi:LacI family transcriptional regulator|nr:LacI family DNA-binding transcriptional regulator [Marinilabiliaceae bacterium]